MKPIVEIDFEFNGTAEPLLNLVCVSYKINGGKPISVWLDKASKDVYKKVAKVFYDLRKTHDFVAYASTAEARAFLSLGLDPHDFNWIDLYAEWLQIRYNNNDYQYGRYLKLNSVTPDGSFKSAHIRKSIAPSKDKEDNYGRDNTETGRGYAGCVCALLGKIVDTAHKTTMRDLIISAPAKYKKKEKAAIIDYCESDLIYLSDIYKKVTSALVELTGCSTEEVHEWQVCRGRYSATCAKMEAHGIPVDMNAVKNLSRNHWQATNDLVIALNEKYVFYKKESKNKWDMKGRWVFKAALFTAWIYENKLQNEWPLTKANYKAWEEFEDDPYNVPEPVKKFSLEDDVLKSFRGIEVINSLRETKKSIQNLNWFRPAAFGQFAGSVGSDSRLRTFFGPFGTQTGRNAPPAKRFPFAMSKWLKCIMRAEDGKSITEIDYSNQEFILGAYKSDDKAMIEAYESGDPYLYFAIAAGGAPEGATKKSHPKPRVKFKATVLGLQYGMGVDKLAVKLRADTGDTTITTEDAKELRTLHRETFSAYWEWIDFIKQTYESSDCLILPDGWLLGPHCDRTPSVCNFPIQGLGACIIREACYLATTRGVDILAPVHDAIYFMHDTGDEATIQIVRDCMAEAVENLVPGCVVRTSTCTHDSTEVWVEEEGAEMYERLKGNLEHKETDLEVLEHLVKKLYKGDENRVKIILDNAYSLSAS